MGYEVNETDTGTKLVRDEVGRATSAFLLDMTHSCRNHIEVERTAYSNRFIVWAWSVDRDDKLSVESTYVSRDDLDTFLHDVQEVLDGLTPGAELQRQHGIDAS
jgi:hypothetical protein